jgi:hypothetical protein
MMIESEMVMEREMRRRGNKYPREDAQESELEDGIFKLEGEDSQEGNWE